MDGRENLLHADMDLLHYRLGWLAAIGIALIAIGLTACYAPYYSGFSLQSLIGSFLALGGAMLVAHGLWCRRLGRLLPELLIGLPYLVFGLFAAGYPIPEAKTLTLLLSVLFATEGVLKVILARGLRPELDRSWAPASGAISLILGGAVLGIPPGTPLLGVMVGLDLIECGLATLMIALAMRKTVEQKWPLCLGNVCFSD